MNQLLMGKIRATWACRFRLDVVSYPQNRSFHFSEILTPGPLQKMNTPPDDPARPLLPSYLGDFVDLALDAILVVDPQTCITYWNPAAEQMFGWRADEVLGRPTSEVFWKVFTPEDREAQRQRLLRLRRGEILRDEFRAPRKDGSYLWVEYMTRPLFDAAGEPLAYLSTHRDITAQKQTIEELEQSRMFVENIAQATPDVMFVFDLEEARLVYANRRLENDLGYTVEQIQALPDLFARLLHPEDLPRLPALLAAFETAAEGEMLTEAYRARAADGTYRWVSIRATVYTRKPDGQVKQVIGTASDITERKRAEQTLAEYARQQAALYQLSDQLFRQNTLEDVFNAALDAILDALQCDRASILLFDARGVMRFVAWRGLSEAYRQATDGHSPWLPDVQNPAPICVNDVETGDIHEPLKTVIRGEGIGSLAFIPLVTNGKLIGKFMTYFNRPHVFSEGEVELSLTIAHQLAFGIDRKRTEQALRESEERYRAVVESQSEMLCRFRVDGTILFVNNAYARARGTTADDLIRKNFWEFIPVEDHHNVRAMLNQLTPAAPEVHIENRFQTPEGERWTLWTNRALKFDSAGRVLEAQSSGIDITERKMMEETLRAERELLARLFETMPVMVSLYEPQTNLMRLNAEFERLLGWRSDEVTIVSILEALYPDPDYRMEVLQRMAAVQRNEWVDVRVQTRAGEVLDTEWSNLSITNDQGELVLGIALGIDVTERKRAQEHMRRAADLDAFRVMLNDTLRPLEDPVLIQREAMRLLGERLQVDRVIYAEIEPDFAVITENFVRGVPDILGRLPLTDFAGPAAEMRAGKNVAISNTATAPDLGATERAAFETLGIVAAMGTPLIKNGQWVAVFAALHGTPRAWQDEEIACLMETAERTWSAVERARAQLALHQSKNELQLLNETLEQKVKEQTLAVRRLASELTKAEQRERHRIAQILHDDLQQRLYAIQMQMTFLGDSSEAGTETWQRDFADINTQLTETIMMARNLSIDLSPPILRDEGLAQAINWLTTQMEEQFGLQVELQAAESFAIPDRDVQVLLYNCVRELLFNIVKHARVGRAVVALQRVNDELRIEVRDEGRGFNVTDVIPAPLHGTPEESRSQSFGLPSIRHRLGLFGGTLDLQSALHEGTTIILKIPVYAPVP